jgi:hypothetical protein
MLLIELSLFQKTRDNYCVNIYGILHSQVVRVLPLNASSATLPAFIRRAGSHIPIKWDLARLYELETG